MNRPKELYDLIDRLQAVSEINHPDRLWSNDFYYECAFRWKNKIPELRERVLTLEAKLKEETEK